MAIPPHLTVSSRQHTSGSCQHPQTASCLDGNHQYPIAHKYKHNMYSKSSANPALHSTTAPRERKSL